MQSAVKDVLPDADVCSVLVRPCPDPKFGDYQSAALMALAKERKINPRQLATDVLSKLDVSEWCEKVEIAGAGFLNFRLKTSTLERALESAARGEHLFFEKTKHPRTVVVDFSSPNVAKPMHVGHIRSTILGDSLARTLRLIGHRVITDNHLGDWGTQFGMMIFAWKVEKFFENDPSLLPDPIAELERVYKLVNDACKGEQKALEYLRSRFSYEIELELDKIEPEGALDWARRELVKLQSGDKENLEIWERLIAISKKQFDTIYNRLGVTFDHTHGESFYNPMLKSIVQELVSKGIARESEGAIAVFSDGSLPPKQDPFLKHEDGEWKPNPKIIQKSDGASNYATTDVATLAYRIKTWHPDEVIYVVGGPQDLHFQQVFAIFRRWHSEAPVKLAHVWFGSILGDDGKPFRTRSGDTVRLSDLLDEAEERAFKVVSDRNSALPEAQRREIARVVGIGAIKYADLLPNRQTDYIFSWDKMLALHGNSVPYLLYTYARIQSIFRTGRVDPRSVTGRNSAVSLGTPEEIALAKQLLIFDLVLSVVVEEYRPNLLCNYLYELAANFARFYEKRRILDTEPKERSSRLALCSLIAEIMRIGLEVLGIQTLDEM
ncbi:MAG TPA: arginine--tRNA ligase [Verrucomicrobiae bacterium]|nr:arginine--tRNA ligase [Verrucomicrobiae bacterium]